MPQPYDHDLLANTSERKMKDVKLPTFVRVLMMAEIIENYIFHPNEALRDKTAVRIIDPMVDDCYIVKTDKIEPKLVTDYPQFTGTVSTIEAPTKITIGMGSLDYSVEAELHREGTTFCVTSGIAAFGATVSEAVSNFKRSLQKDTP